MLDQAPWWARFIVTLALIGLAGSLLRSGDQLAIAGGILGGVVSHWLPSSSSIADRRVNGAPTP